ncbi:MAG: hypothetical protein ABEN55_09305 [Bradymonadaceae bacterium]
MKALTKRAWWSSGQEGANSDGSSESVQDTPPPSTQTQGQPDINNNLGKGIAIGGGAALAGLGAKHLWDRYQKSKQPPRSPRRRARPTQGRAPAQSRTRTASLDKEANMANTLLPGDLTTDDVRSTTHVTGEVMDFVQEGQAKDKAEEALRHGNVDRARDLLGIDPPEQGGPTGNGPSADPYAREQIKNLKETGAMAGGAALGIGGVLGAKKMFDKYRRQKARRPMPSQQEEPVDSTRSDRHDPQRGHMNEVQ